MKAVFVRVVSGEGAYFGVGKLIGRKGNTYFIEYFDSPTSATVVLETEDRFVESVTLTEQTRVYHFDTSLNAWEIGRLLDDHGDSQFVQFPNKQSRHLKADAVFVRWARPIEDPTPFLANRINESPRFSDGRSAFVRSQMRQRAASMGISALLACAVELEAHQVEVMRRILQDPVQRYLLADEVGLGKTIEAGVLIRQCVLDAPLTCSILVIVPAALLGQWRGELTGKFFLGRSLDRNIQVVAYDEAERIRVLLPKATMLVIDEAHHLTERAFGGVEGIYADIVAAAPTIDRVLLLSATPALHNERGFLQMLHLLDPTTYPLDGEDALRRKMNSRQALAEIVAGLTPENALYLDYTVDQLAVLFPDDELLQEHLTALRGVIDSMPEEGDPALVEAIDRLHAHLSEVYRLHRRILRHRRRSIAGLTPNRAGAEIVRYRSCDRAALTVALDDWRFEEVAKFDADGSLGFPDDRLRAFHKMLDRTSQYPYSRSGSVEIPVGRTATTQNPDGLAEIDRCLERPGLFEDRVRALITALEPALRTQTQCVIFCSDIKTANALAERITATLGVGVVRHDPKDDAWTGFAVGGNHPILVCDRRAEEGLNLQGGKKIVVHYDVPPNANRIEQRLGRVDRYGSGMAVRSLVLVCADDPTETAWVDFLDSALRVFDRSVASLQYLIEQLARDMVRLLFTDGVEALTELTAKCAGDQGLIDREIRAMDQQDALDSLGSPPADLVDELCDVDDDWQTLARDTALWLEQTLQFGRFDEAAFVAGACGTRPFRYVYSTSNPHTLVTLPNFVTHCADALDLSLDPLHRRLIRTIPYTYRRRTALNSAARAKGVGLLRYGDVLISGMTTLTEGDDRGRSFAMWRFAPGHSGDPVADIYFRFDFILEADVSQAVRVLADHDRDTSAARAAVHRRGDMALTPAHRSIWLDRELATVDDAVLLCRLGRAYSVEPDVDGAVDINLNAQRWRRLMKLQLPEITYWSELCGKARDAAEAALRTDSDLIVALAQAEQRAARVDHGRLGQLRARVRSAIVSEGEEELTFEEELAAALRSGIRAPRVRVDTIGAVFLSGSRSATDQVSGRI